VYSIYLQSAVCAALMTADLKIGTSGKKASSYRCGKKPVGV